MTVAGLAFRLLPRNAREGVNAFLSASRHQILSGWPSDIAYDQQDINAFRLARFKNWLIGRGYERPRPGGVGILTLLAEAINRPVSVLDFGGAFGETGLCLQHSDRGMVDSFCVVESEGIVAASQEANYPTPIGMTSKMPNHRHERTDRSHARAPHYAKNALRLIESRRGQAYKSRISVH